MKTRLLPSIAALLLATGTPELARAALIHHWTFDSGLADRGTGANPLVLRSNASLKTVGGGALYRNAGIATFTDTSTFNPALRPKGFYQIV